jgi:hypothetical protein
MAFIPNGDQGGGDLTITSDSTLSGEYINIDTFTIDPGIVASVVPYWGNATIVPWDDTTQGGYVIIRADNIIIDGTLTAKGAGYLGGNGGHGGRGRQNNPTQGKTNGSFGTGTFGPVIDMGYFGLSGNSNNGDNPGRNGGYNRDRYNTEVFPSSYETLADEEIRERLYIGGGGAGGNGGKGASGSKSPGGRPGNIWNSLIGCPEWGSGYCCYHGGGGGGAGARGGGYIKLYGSESITINGFVNSSGESHAKKGARGGEFNGPPPDQGASGSKWCGATWYTGNDWPANKKYNGGDGGDASIVTTQLRQGGKGGGNFGGSHWQAADGVRCPPAGQDPSTSNWDAVVSQDNNDATCHTNRLEGLVRNGHSGKDGGYGGPGGILLHSYGQISVANPQSLNLRHGNDRTNFNSNIEGGTLKVFYGDTSGWLDTVSPDYYGVLYTELAYNGWAPSGEGDNGQLGITPLTGADPKFDVASPNSFDIDWNEGLGFLDEPSGSNTIHNGFNLYRKVSNTGVVSAPGDDPSTDGWTYVTTISYSASTGGDHITTPYTYTYTDNIAFLTESVRNQIFYTQRRLDYLIVSHFTIGGLPIEDGSIQGHPAETLPTLTLNQLGAKSTPRLTDGSYWDDRIESSSNNVSGYDDLLMNDRADTYWGSFELTGWNWDFDDNLTNIGDPNPNTNITFGTTNASRVWPGALSAKNSPVTEEYTYKDPSRNGLSGSRFNGFPGEPDGLYTVVTTATANNNIYGGAPVSLSSSGTVQVFERPPEAVFYAVGDDLPDGNGNTYPDLFGDNGRTIYSPGRIISGIAPLSASFTDYSLARTWPISSWEIEYLGNTRFSPVTYSREITESCWECSDPDFTERDKQTFRLDFLSGFTYDEPGLYRPTLTIETSTTHVSVSSDRAIYAFAPQPTADFVISGGLSVDIETIEEFVPIRVAGINSSISGYWPLSAAVWEIYDSHDRTFISNVCSIYTDVTSDIIHDWKWHTHNDGTVNNSLDNICLTVYMSATDAYLDEFSGTPGLEEGLVDKKCVHLKLKEKGPDANLFVTSLSTVSSNYSADDPVVLNNITIGSVISGYSPNLTVTFTDSSIPQSYPISGYAWDFGDYYSDTGQTSSVIASQQFSGWYSDAYDAFQTGVYPSWSTDAVNNSTVHTYEMPGFYTATLTVQASTTETQSVCTQSIFVEEILAQGCGFQSRTENTDWSDTVSLSGFPPMTVFFNATGIIPGSFPIGRIDWDFGDGTDIYEVNRWPDNVDPRDEVVSHTFHRHLYSEPSTFTVSISVYSDRTNSFTSCSGENWTTSASGYNVGPINLPSYGSGTKAKHLIKNRMYNGDNELLLVFENDTDLETQTVLLST